MSVTSAIAWLASTVGGLSGIKYAPTAPVESSAAFPFGVVYENRGSLDIQAAGFGNNLATIYIEIHVERSMLPEAINLAMTFRDPLMHALIGSPNLGGTVSTVNDIRYRFGYLDWGGAKTVGYRFEVDVKVGLEV